MSENILQVYGLTETYIHTYVYEYINLMRIPYNDSEFFTLVVFLCFLPIYIFSDFNHDSSLDRDDLIQIINRLVDAEKTSDLLDEEKNHIINVVSKLYI